MQSKCNQKHYKQLSEHKEKYIDGGDSDIEEWIPHVLSYLKLPTPILYDVGMQHCVNTKSGEHNGNMGDSASYMKWETEYWRGSSNQRGGS